MLKIANWTIKNFNQDQVVLENINLTFKENELVAIIGLSGVGKTTLLNSLALNAKILSGKIFFNNDEINLTQKRKWKKYRKKIGIISQKNTLVEDISVYDNLKYVMSERNNIFCRFFNIINRKQKEEIYQVLSELGIITKVFYRVSDLSGGEAQRVEIAKLFIKKPKIILADEPTSNLDLTNSYNIISMLKKLMINNHAIAIINMHDVDQLKKNINRVIAIKNKKVFFDKKPKEVKQKNLSDLYGK